MGEGCVFAGGAGGERAGAGRKNFHGGHASLWQGTLTLALVQRRFSTLVIVVQLLQRESHRVDHLLVEVRDSDVACFRAVTEVRGVPCDID